MQLTESDIACAYEDYGHLVLRRCRAILRDPTLAGDALQEVFVRLMRYGGGFRDAEDPLRWLYRVAERVCFDLLRKRRAAAEVSAGEDFAAVIEAPGPSAASAIADREVVMELLGRFDEETRTIALLYFLDGLSQERVAAEAGVSRQTVNKKLARVRARAAALRATLEGV